VAEKKPKSNGRSEVHHNILLVADDADFASTVKARWQMERQVPGFTVIGSSLVRGSAGAQFQMVVVGPIKGARLDRVLSALASDSKPVIVVAPDSDAATHALQHTPLLVRQHDGWLDALVVLAGEVLRRVEAHVTTAKNGHSSLTLEHQATLGRFMVEMKHGCNNAMTSIVGNSELLLMEPGALSAEVREQIETIHSMSLRLYEVWQRFSSLQAELESASSASHPETKPSSKAAVSSR
jgi:signal transduction histidine kinase